MTSNKHHDVELCCGEQLRNSIFFSFLTGRKKEISAGRNSKNLKFRIRSDTPLFLWMSYIWNSRVTACLPISSMFSSVFQVGIERERGGDGESKREKQSNESGNRECTE